LGSYLSGTTLTENFIEKYSDKVDWKFISIFQKLSESFMENHSDKIDWKYISIYQTLSESFIDKYADKLNWYYVPRHQNIKYPLDFFHIRSCMQAIENFYISIKMIFLNISPIDRYSWGKKWLDLIKGRNFMNVSMIIRCIKELEYLFLH
jgi:hypothetical protein